MNTFYFNTGVRPETVSNFPYDYHRKQGHKIRGTLLIPFDCEAPKNDTLMFLCDNPNLKEASLDNVTAYPVSNTTMLSKCAYFKHQ